MKTTFEKVKNYSELLVLSFDLIAVLTLTINLLSFIKIRNYMLEISLLNLILILCIIALTTWYIIIKIKKIKQQYIQFDYCINKINESLVISKYLNYKINFQFITGTFEGISENERLKSYFNDDEIFLLVEHGYINLTLK